MVKGGLAVGGARRGGEKSCKGVSTWVSGLQHYAWPLLAAAFAVPRRLSKACNFVAASDVARAAEGGRDCEAVDGLFASTGATGLA